MGAEKTIVSTNDVHSEIPGAPGLFDALQSTNYEVANVLDETGDLAVVGEGFPEGVGPADTRTVIHTEASEGIGQYQFLAENPDVNLIGSVSWGEYKSDLALLKQYLWANEIYSNPENSACLTPGLNLRDAMLAVDGGSTAPVHLECVGRFDAEVDRVSDEFQEDRMVDAPQDEIRAALYADESVVYVPSGMIHREEKARAAKEAGVNYIEVAPEGFSVDWEDYSGLRFADLGDYDNVCSGWTDLNK